MIDETLCAGLRAEFRRRVFQESIPRLGRCLDMLSEDQVWGRVGPLANPPGNLILHLEGNARQWILSGLFGHPDTRRRQEEFDFSGRIPKAGLIGRLGLLQQEIDPLLDGLTAAELLRSRPVQIYEETGLSILVHVIEHFSYHTGQVAWITKWLTGQDTGFYAGESL